MWFAAVSLVLLVAACGSLVTATPTTAPVIGPAEQEAPTTTTVSCTALPVFQSDSTFGPPIQVETGSVWRTEWATVTVRFDVTSGEEVEHWTLPAIGGEAVTHVVDGGLAALLDLDAGPSKLRTPPPDTGVGYAIWDGVSCSRGCSRS